MYVWDHPRIRGEHRKNDKKALTKSGSPPHTRGTRKATIKDYLLAGITPAYAGNTYPQFQIPSVSGDHPRIRGEHYQPFLNNTYILGSPPHTRGTLGLAEGMEMARGITPAYAGNTLQIVLKAVASQDHPRIRGEH
ncbi:hypothetical protein HMPREF0381_0529 [Lachnoanaerobaculum saburreum DSM 3986]|uniref:Uncharacterized protein n=1 Tax=Lachnoanaerobaculum saburreum DSM 3986 TaxID=887325 RepID=E6LKP4_9FIRM|nr:hypothetical protein HMPREF0381_0529 [Lachnoanaerobaculum saburreum DSM 3986]